MDRRQNGMLFRRGCRTVLLVEQNAPADLGTATHGVVMESGRIRLTGTGAQVLAPPEMRTLYLGGTAAAAEAADG